MSKLILGNGAVTMAQKNSDDAVLLTIICELRDIEQHIRLLLNQANTDCEDFASLKHIVETISL